MFTRVLKPQQTHFICPQPSHGEFHGDFDSRGSSTTPMVNRPTLFWILFVLCAVSFRTVSCFQNSLSSEPPLRCCFLRELPISFYNPQVYTNNGLDGVVAGYLREHQAYLNWSCATMTPFPQEDDNGFNQFIDTMFNCTNKKTGRTLKSSSCQCDIGIGGFLQNAYRLHKVDLLPPFVIDSDRAFAHISSTNVSGNVWFFVDTFDGTVWICILILFISFVILKMFDHRFAKVAPYSPLPKTNSWFTRFLQFLKESGHLQRLRSSMQSTASRMVLLSDTVDNGNSFRHWFLNLVIGVIAVFLFLSYEASMTASLIQESVVTSFSSAEDFRSCKIPPSEVCLPRGGGLQYLWTYHIAIRKCHDNSLPTYFSSYEELFEAVDSRKCKYGIGMESAINAAIRGRYCGRLVTLGAPVSSGGLSMVLPKGSPLTTAMSHATLHLKKAEMMPRLVKYFDELPPCTTEVNTTLSFRKLRLFFVMAFVMVALIWLSFVLYPQNTKGSDAEPTSSQS